MAASDENDALADFSNYGATSVDLAAPGVGILSTVPGGGYESLGWSGTSMATPHVSGAVALCAARFPSETMTQRVERILGHVDPVASLRGRMTTGGRLDVAVAVNTGVPAPTVTSFTPASGPVGTSVTITGTGFTGTTAVAFNGAAATTRNVVGDTQITATVPAGATSGTIAVTTPGGTGASAASFTVTPSPSITKLKPASAKRGATVTITGTDFGAAQDTSSVKFGSRTCTRYVSWSATQIKCKVPAKARYGAVQVTVTTTAGKSNAVSFTVKR